MILLAATLILALSLVQAKDKLCWDDYPELSGLLCYKTCRSGYYGVGPVCWSSCPPRTTDIGALCTKKTYSRGVGKTLRFCRSGTEKNGALCYPKCASGFYGVGPVCWQYCPSGYSDDGALCRRNAHIYGRNTGSCPWYDKCGLWNNCGHSCKSGYKNDGCTCRKDVHIFAKKTKGRGVGEVMRCADNEDNVAGLCYPKCKSGYYGVSFLCWASCSGETTDTGTQCQKKTYGRGVGKVINCFTPPKCSDFGGCTGLTSPFTGLTGYKVLTGAVCSQLYRSTKGYLAIVQTLAGCFKNEDWKTVSISYSAGAGVGLAGGAEVGIGLDANTNKGICYVGGCYGFKTDISIGAEINFGFWKSLDSIPGESKMGQFGVDIPFTEIGFSVGWVHSVPANDFIGIVFSVGVGIGISPLELGSYKCNTPQSGIAKFDG